MPNLTKCVLKGIAYLPPVDQIGLCRNDLMR